MWGRVRGDGNCFWRAAAHILDLPWSDTKEAAFQQQDTLRPVWKDLFQVDDGAWQALMAAQKTNAYANEASCTLLAHAYQRPVVIVGGGGVIYVTWTGDNPVWEDMLVFRLRSEHYVPLAQDVTVSMVRAMQQVKPLANPMSFSGGGRRKQNERVTSVCTWNVAALQSQLYNALGVEESVLLAQETGLTARGQRHVAAAAAEQGWKFFPGVPVPVGPNRDGRRWRARKSEVPGIGFLVKDTLHAGSVDCLTAPGRWLAGRGRFGWLRVGMAVGYLLLGNVYFPTGDSQVAVKDRQACHDALQAELSAWRQVPILVAGDWNSPPNNNPTLGALTLSGWACPPHFSARELATSTFRGPQGLVEDSLLDYWLCSPRLACIDRQWVRHSPNVGHSRVSIWLDGLASEPAAYLVPSPPVCERERVMCTLVRELRGMKYMIKSGPCSLIIRRRRHGLSGQRRTIML